MSRQLKTAVVVENGRGPTASWPPAMWPSSRPMATRCWSAAFRTWPSTRTCTRICLTGRRDFDGVSLLVNTPFLLVASRQAGVDSLAALVAKAKAQPGALNFASAGRGNSTHLVVEMLARRSGITLTHVPYNGAAAGPPA
ncbi:tripartite tricarboxylate transporter substrate-binding protein [Achromobacter insuavis]